MSDRLTSFRTSYRQTIIPRWYSGWAHFSLTFFSCSMGIAIGTWKLTQFEDVWKAAIVIPLSFLFANIVEYLGHRGPMHHRTRGLYRVFDRHTLQHHRFFTSDAMNIESAHDYHMVLFPPILLIFFLGFILVPISIGLYLALGSTVAIAFAVTGLAYFLLYECLHLTWHQPENSWIWSIPLLRSMRWLHQVHHDPKQMAIYNFNITFPIADRIFGTLAPKDKSSS